MHNDVHAGSNANIQTCGNYTDITNIGKAVVRASNGVKPLLARGVPVCEGANKKGHVS